MEEILQKIKDTGLCVIGYPQTKMLNIEDKAGIIHSYYTTTGTIILRHSNYQYDKYKIYYKNCTVSEVIDLCLHPERIQQLIKEQYREK